MIDEPQMLKDMRQALEPLGVVFTKFEKYFGDTEISFSGVIVGWFEPRAMRVASNTLNNSHNIPDWNWKRKIEASIDPEQFGLVAHCATAPIIQNPLAFGALLKAIQALPDCKP
mgnify:CR=1 FL=1